MNQRASQLVGRIQLKMSELQIVRSQLWALNEEYNAKGGQSFIHQHFVEGGQPRADLDITEAAVVTAVYAMGEILSVLTTHRDNIANIA